MLMLKEPQPALDHFGRRWLADIMKKSGPFEPSDSGIAAHRPIQIRADWRMGGPGDRRGQPHQKPLPNLPRFGRMFKHSARSLVSDPGTAGSPPPPGNLT